MAFSMSADELAALVNTPVKREVAAATPTRSPAAFLWSSPKTPAPVVAFAPAQRSSSGLSHATWTLMLVVSGFAMWLSYMVAFSEDAVSVTELATSVRFARELDGLTFAGAAARYRPEAPLYPMIVFAMGLYVERRSFCADVAIERAFSNVTIIPWLPADEEARSFGSVLDSAGTKVLLFQAHRDVSLARAAEVLVGTEPTPTLSPIAAKLALLTDADFKRGSTVRLVAQSGWLFSSRFRLDINGRTRYVGGAAEARAIFERVLVTPKTASKRLRQSIRFQVPAMCGWHGRQ